MRNAIELTARWAAIILIVLFFEACISFGALISVPVDEWHWAIWIAQSCVLFLTFYGAICWTESDARDEQEREQERARWS